MGLVPLYSMSPPPPWIGSWVGQFDSWQGLGINHGHICHRFKLALKWSEV